MQVKPNVHVDMRTRTVGPAHDPYGQTITEVRTDQAKALMVECGLTGTTLTVDTPDGRSLGFIWHDHSDQQRIRAELVCIDVFGMTIADMQDLYHQNWEPDPMGSLARYI